LISIQGITTLKITPAQTIRLNKQSVQRFGLVQAPPQEAAPQPTAPATSVAPAQPAPRPEDQSILRQVADLPLNTYQGAVTGVRLVADAYDATSSASKSLREVEEYIGGLMSAQSKNDKVWKKLKL
jgi:hypothetical protein